MTTRSLCLDGRYLINNPAWHVEESAKQIVRMLRRNRISPSNVYSTELAREAILWEYDISPQAIELARNRADERLQFRRRDFRDVKDAYFELILGLDVIEHLQDYFGFLLPLEGEGPPQDFSHSPGSFGANRMAQRRAAQTPRHVRGHLRYFTKRRPSKRCRKPGTRFRTVSTRRGRIVSGRRQPERVLKLPRWLFFNLHEDPAVRIPGGYSLLVLARSKHSIIRTDRVGRGRCAARAAGTGTSRQDASPRARKCSSRFRGECGAAGPRLPRAIAPGKSGPW